MLLLKIAANVKASFARACYEEFMHEMSNLSTANNKLYLLSFKTMNEIPDFDTRKTQDLACIRAVINKSWTNVLLSHPKWAVRAVANTLVKTGMLSRKHKRNRYQIYKALMSLHNRQTSWADTRVD